MKHSALLWLIVLISTAHAAIERPTEFYDPDVQRLLPIKMFAFGPIGDAGSTSEGEAAFGAIVKKKEAIRFILAAFEYGGDHARCYVLVALRESSPVLFGEAMARARKNPPKKITVMNGCLMSDVTLGAIYDAIEAGFYASYFTHYENER